MHITLYGIGTWKYWQELVGSQITEYKFRGFHCVCKLPDFWAICMVAVDCEVS